MAGTGGLRLDRSRKIYYSITEVAEMAAVKAHVLRYWETEFSALRPKKNRAGNRTYREKDVRLVLLIRKLLYEEGFTIKGARKKLQERKASDLDQIEIPFVGSEASGAAASASAAATTAPVASGRTAPPAPARSDGADSTSIRELREELEDILSVLSA
jgi:DNA-binding transcriptional MerR regulator